ncbi:MAG: hypothetical protein WCC12_00425, partial [Anaerolineales bacterium]
TPEAAMMQINVLRLRTMLLNLLSNLRIVPWGRRILFTVGILLFSAVQLTMVILPIRSRTAPVETDDAYTYILKAAEMQECFLQDCLALNDLRQQLTTPAKKQHIAWMRYREYVRAFSVYHPLHSLILTGLHATGLSWEDSYNFVEIAGSLFLSLAIGYWLYRLFGSGPAGIALLFLTFTPLPNQGLHYIVPSNLALGIAILSWGMLLKRSPRSRWIVVGSTLALVTMHPIGRLYALLVVFLFILLNAKQMKRSDWWASGLSVLIVATTFLLPLLITRPELSFPAEPPPAGWKVWSGYYNNITEAAALAGPWFNLHGGNLLSVLLISMGLLSLPPFERRRRVGSMVFLLGGLLFASLLQVLPRYPAEAFGRIWIPSAILLTGLIAYGTWRWLAAVVHWSRQYLQSEKSDFRDERWILSGLGWTLVFLLLFAAVLAHNSLNLVMKGRAAYRDTLINIMETQDSRLDTNQPSVLLKTGCKDVLYLSEVPMHMYLAHGALECGAIYYPTLAGTPEEIHWIEENRNAGYVVAWNPTIEAGATKGGSPLVIKTGDRLEFSLPEHWTSQQIYIYLENSRGDSRLDVAPLEMEAGSKPVERLSIPANWSGWQAIDLRAEELADGFRLEADQVPNGIFLRGIKSDPEGPLNWPWDQGITLIHQRSNPDDPAVEISFDTADLVPYSDWSLTVVDDQGDTVLIKLNR